eukprot:scaffold15669_cov160-Amphora_coffeaeformis.AAC.7
MAWPAVCSGGAPGSLEKPTASSLSVREHDFKKVPVVITTFHTTRQQDSYQDTRSSRRRKMTDR